MEDEVAIASSSIEAGIGCWVLRSGAEHLRYRSCASPPHGLVSVVGRFLASSQLRDSSSSSGSVLFWSWNKVEVRGGVSGHIYLWEEGGFDLDMTYITDNLIAMGFPAGDISSGFFGYVEGFYRNNMEEVIRFFETYHKMLG
ncbi:unnamed protein product [Lactuca saligna]|uniref:Uncharacterized protein n=1 Tax=Lactuca saligna TaxID=75948 RepID=A0AA35Y3T9_LACSI|nr:unnamed protein product [Lactuca saligna]